MSRVSSILGLGGKTLVVAAALCMYHGVLVYLASPYTLLGFCQISLTSLIPSTFVKEKNHFFPMCN